MANFPSNTVIYIHSSQGVITTTWEEYYHVNEMVESEQVLDHLSMGFDAIVGGGSAPVFVISLKPETTVFMRELFSRKQLT